MPPHRVPPLEAARAPMGRPTNVVASTASKSSSNVVAPVQLRMPTDLKKPFEEISFGTSSGSDSTRAQELAPGAAEGRDGSSKDLIKRSCSPTLTRKKGSIRSMTMNDTAKSWTFVKADESTHSCEGSLVDHICIVSARLHRQRLEHTCSWLHQWEHARALHHGLAQGDVNWTEYSVFTGEPDLKKMVEHLQSLIARAGLRRLESPKESVWTQIPETESLEELQAAFKLGTVHFTGEMTLDGMRRPVVKLNPAQVGMGSNLYRRCGSDRFFRLKVEKKIIHAAVPPFAGESYQVAGEDQLHSSLKTFFHHSIVIFGRVYQPFCQKDGATIYWCTSGPQIPTITLVEFCQNYIDVNLNHSMSVAKWIARFELGLTPTTPTVVFPRAHVLRVPDLMSDSLTISYDMMRKVYDELRRQDWKSEGPREDLPEGFVPSAIRGCYWIEAPKGAKRDVQRMVWRLDFSTCPHDAELRSLSTLVAGPSIVQVRSNLRKGASRSVRFRFDIKKKNGVLISTEMTPLATEIDYVDGEGPRAREVVMTDGCGLISHAAMTQIADMLTAAEGDGKMLKGLPPAVQGRLGPGKGVWAIAPRSPWGVNALFIEVRDSQWKFDDAQTQQFIFELHSIPSPRDSAKLGKQTFEVLAHCGVPTGIFRALLKEQLRAICDPFFDFSDLGKLLYHIEKATPVNEERLFKARTSSDPKTIRDRLWGADDATDEIDVGDQDDETGGFVLDRRLDVSSGAPNTILECVVGMLQAGLSPDGSQSGACPPLGAKLDRIALEQVRKSTSFKLTSGQCRTALVVADHLGLLNEGEIFFQASDAIQHQGRFSNVVTGDVLVTRPPAVQPCDVQKFKAVFYSEFRHVYDLIIMPIKGDRPACSVLSGGDYDGDKLLIITDPTIVNAFDSSKADPNFADPPFADSEYFLVDSRRVSSSVSHLIHEGDSSSLSRILISGFFQDARFGQLSKMHTKLSYSLGLDHPTSRFFGHLFTRALDGKKQGLTMSNKHWKKIQALLPPGLLAPEWPEHDDGKLNIDLSGIKFAVRPKHLGKHVMDELVNEGRAALENAPKKWREVSKGWMASIDDDLAGTWCQEWAMAKRINAIQHGGDPFYRDLRKILAHVKEVFSDYRMMLAAWQKERDGQQAMHKAHRAPGSPSPKRDSGWKSSSRSQKEDLVNCAKKLWSIIDGHQFESSRLKGPEGTKCARTIIASCCYIEPLMPEPIDAPTSLLQRLRAAAPPVVALVPTPPPLSPTSGAFEREDEASMDGIETSQEDNISISGESFAWSPGEWAEVDRAAEAPLVQRVVMPSRTNSSQSSMSHAPYQSSTTTTIPSASPTSAIVVVSTATDEPSPFVARADERRPSYRVEFRDAGSSSKWRFAYDMCHRDILGLKTDALWAKVHGEVATAKGIQGVKVAPEMLGLMSINKSLAGISKAHATKGPRTLLTDPDTSTSPELVARSPKKPRL